MESTPNLFRGRIVCKCCRLKPKNIIQNTDNKNDNKTDSSKTDSKTDSSKTDIKNDK